MNTAVSYLRYRGSGEHTLDRQRTACAHAAARRGLCLVGEYVDANASTREHRPGLARAMRAAHRGRIGLIIVASGDRLTRSVEEHQALVAELRRCGVELVIATEGDAA